MDTEYFPKDKTEYYYYFRIKNIEQAKETYNQCNRLILDKSQGLIMIKELMSEDELQQFYTSYQKLYDDFNVVADRLINGENMQDTEDFKRLAYQLMIISNETIDFIQTFYYEKESEIKKLALKFDGKMVDVEKILLRNLKVPELINPDEFLVVTFNRFGRYIINTVIVLCTSITLYLVCRFYTGFQTSDLIEMMGAGFCAVIFLVASAYMTYFRLKFKRKFELMDVKNKSYFRNYPLVYHPFTSRIAIRDLIAFIKSIINFCIDIKE